MLTFFSSGCNRHPPNWQKLIEHTLWLAFLGREPFKVLNWYPGQQCSNLEPDWNHVNWKTLLIVGLSPRSSVTLLLQSCVLIANCLLCFSLLPLSLVVCGSPVHIPIHTHRYLVDIGCLIDFISVLNLMVYITNGSACIKGCRYVNIKAVLFEPEKW